MRTIIVSVVLACVGLGIGSIVAFSRVSHSSSPRVGQEIITGQHEKENGENSVKKDAPRVEVEKEDFDFGSMDGNGKGTHDFIFKNIGPKPLTLEKGDTSCKCTLSKLEKTELAPGESAKVTLEWKGAGLSGEYRQTATINTNDPSRPMVTLSIFGQITHAIRVQPHEVVFSRLSDDETATAEANVLAYLAKPLEIKGTSWSDEEIAKPFSAVVEPLSKEALKEVDE